MKPVLRFFAEVMVTSFAVAEPIIIKFSHVTSPDSPKGKGAALFQKRVNERLAGKVEVEVYPNASLFSDADELEALKNNEVQMLAPSLSKFSSYTEQFAIFDLPFLFKDVDSLQKFWKKKAGTDLLNAVSNQNVVGLSFWSNGMKQIISAKPIPLMSSPKMLFLICVKLNYFS